MNIAEINASPSLFFGNRFFLGRVIFHIFSQIIFIRVVTISLLYPTKLFFIKKSKISFIKTRTLLPSECRSEDTFWSVRIVLDIGFQLNDISTFTKHLKTIRSKHLHCSLAMVEKNTHR